jgi:hypothetical protein
MAINNGKRYIEQSIDFFPQQSFSRSYSDAWPKAIAKRKLQRLYLIVLSSRSDSTPIQQHI